MGKPGNSVYVTDATDLPSFLEPDGPLPASVIRFTEYLGSIIAGASHSPSSEWQALKLTCRRRPGRRPCPGSIRTRIHVGFSPHHLDSVLDVLQRQAGSFKTRLGHSEGRVKTFLRSEDREDVILGGDLYRSRSHGPPFLPDCTENKDQISPSSPFRSRRLSSFCDGPLGCFSPISH